MAKQQTFGDKVAKAGNRPSIKCPVCDQPMTFVRVISPVSTGKGNCRFQNQMQKVCKCNSAEIMGS